MKFLLDKLILYGPKQFLSHFLYELYLICFVRIIKNSYSQSQEDLIIDKILNYKKKGFYVDVGAYDPTRFSNTKRFYKRGWRGINIEPDYNNYTKFVRQRQRDINLNIGISNKDMNITFYQFNPDTVSTFSKTDATKYQKYGFILKEKVLVQTKKLSSILTRYAKGKQIDFMTIDTEGFELLALISNDWTRFRPKVICVETGDHSFTNKSEFVEKGVRRKKVKTYMTKIGYREVFRNNLNAIFIFKR